MSNGDLLPGRQLMGDHGTIILHCSVMGRVEIQARKFSVEEPMQRYAQYDTAVRINFVRQGKRKSASVVMTPDNTRYATIEVAGREVYDSRKDVPCDMGEWTATDERFHNRRGITIVRA